MCVWVGKGEQSGGNCTPWVPHQRAEAVQAQVQQGCTPQHSSTAARQHSSMPSQRSASYQKMAAAPSESAVVAAAVHSSSETRPSGVLEIWRRVSRPCFSSLQRRRSAGEDCRAGVFEDPGCQSAHGGMKSKEPSSGRLKQSAVYGYWSAPPTAPPPSNPVLHSPHPPTLQPPTHAHSPHPLLDAHGYAAQHLQGLERVGPSRSLPAQHQPVCPLAHAVGHIADLQSSRGRGSQGRRWAGGTRQALTGGGRWQHGSEESQHSTAQHSTAQHSRPPAGDTLMPASCHSPRRAWGWAGCALIAAGGWR